MIKSTLSKGRRLAIALAISASAVAATPVLAGSNKQLGPPVAAGQARYLIEYNAGNKQAVHDAIAQYGGKVIYDYSALFNGLAADLPENGRKSLRTSGLVRTIELDDVRDLHGGPVRHVEGDEASLNADGGIAEVAPQALPAGFPDGAVFSEFVGWDRDRANSDIVWSTAPNFGTAADNVAAPNVAGGSVTGAGVVVAVLDTGIDYDHPDLAANIINDCGSGVIRDFLSVNGGPDDCPEDDTFNGHGTSVASVIASVDNSVGLIGNAPGAKIRPYRVCDGTCPLSAIIGGLVQATVDGVDVINMSFGGGAGFNLEASAVQAANARGIVLVGSAGNGASQKVHFPAGYDTVLAVGATNGPNPAVLDQPASFTNTGGWVDLTGPGVNNPTATCTGCVTAGVVDEISPVDRAPFQANELTNSPITTVTNQEVVNVGRACSSLGDTLTASPSGKVALITRGSCSFAEKVAFAEGAGAIATIIRNNAAGNFFGTLGAYFPSGPSVSISMADGATLAADIASATTTADVGVVRTGIEYWLISGTSFSGPTVAGVAALVLEANPSLSPIQVRNIIESTAEPIGPQVIFGKGMVQADDAVNAALP